MAHAKKGHYPARWQPRRPEDTTHERCWEVWVKIGSETSQREARNGCRWTSVVLCSHQQTFDLNGGLEVGEMKHRALSRHAIRGVARRDEALWMVPV